MPKMKTHSATKKRFKKTKNGIKRSKAFRRHHAWSKSPKRVRQLRKPTHVQSCDLSHVTTLLPY